LAEYRSKIVVKGTRFKGAALAKTEQDRAPFHKEQSPEPFIRKAWAEFEALPCSTTHFHTFTRRW